jgi:hypothetical protein
MPEPTPIPVQPTPTPVPIPRDPFAWWDAYLGYHDVRLDSVVLRADWENQPCTWEPDAFGCQLAGNIWLNPDPPYWYDRASVIGHELGHTLGYDENDGPAIMWYDNWQGYDIWCSVEAHC